MLIYVFLLFVAYAATNIDHMKQKEETNTKIPMQYTNKSILKLNRKEKVINSNTI